MTAPPVVGRVPFGAAPAHCNSEWAARDVDCFIGLLQLSRSIKAIMLLHMLRMGWEFNLPNPLRRAELTNKIWRLNYVHVIF